MRSFGLISSLGLVSILAIMSCVLDPTADQSRTAAQGQELNSASGDPAAVANPPTTDESTIEFPLGDAITPRANCSVVQFCNAPGSDGSVCQQQGCSLGAAENECKSEVVNNVCGAATCPLIFVTSGGTRISLSCPPKICAGGAIECGGNCCGTSATFCAGTRCCDGIHCGGGCPC